MVRTMKLATTTAIAALMATQAFSADVTVNMLSIAQTPDQEAYLTDIGKAYEAAHPGVTVDIQYQDDESFKVRLPTLLQSSSRPDIFFSWGGGVMEEQAKAGVLQDIGPMLSDECTARFSQAGLDFYSVDGVRHGLPQAAADVVMWYNKDLADKAGVDAENIKTWEQFLNAVKKAKDAGITPIIAGGKDKWPLQMYWGFLAIRMVGADGIAAASAGEDGGFANEKFVEVGEKFKELADLEPFEPGFMDTTYDKATGLFGDGNGMFQLMGNWDYTSSKAASTSGEGLTDEQTGAIVFPMVEGGAGDPAATLGGMQGWLVSEGASQEAVDFLCFVMNEKNQSEYGARGFGLPVVKGTTEAISNPYYAQFSEDIANSPYHQLFFNEAYGKSVGGTMDDAAADLASGATTPEEAAQAIEEARMFQ